MLQVNIENEDGFFGLYWDQFKDFDSFSNFISKSGKVSTIYFTINSLDIQKKPKFQCFVHSKEEALPNILSSAQLLFSIPYSRPLQLLGQPNYWSELTESYFQNIHPIIPLFSIHSFNPKTASKFLLSAIYYGGFLFMQYKPLELISYFSEYSKSNVKDISGSISLQSTQAMAIYAFLFIIDGNYTLSKHCQSQAIRMSYTIGLHLNLKKLTPILQYNRLKLFSVIFTVHIGCYAISQFSLNQITEYEDYNVLLLNPEYQVPNSNCSFYLDTEDENVVYGYCADTYSKVHFMVIRFLWTVNKCSEKYLRTKFEKILADITQKYEEITLIYNRLSQEYPHLQFKIQTHRIHLALMYHPLILEAYRILKIKVKVLKPNQVSKMISETCIVFDSVIESKKFIPVTHVYPYTAGLNFIYLYPISNSFERSLIKQKLVQVLDLLSNSACSDKLSYLIIKNEYELILKSESKTKSGRFSIKK